MPFRHLRQKNEHEQLADERFPYRQTPIMDEPNIPECLFRALLQKCPKRNNHYNEQLFLKLKQIHCCDELL